MKKNYFKKGMFIMFLTLSFQSNSQTLLGEYAFADNGLCPHNPNTTVMAQPANATFSSYTSVGTVCNSGTNFQFGNAGWETGSTVNLTQYNQFTITPSLGYELNLSSIQFGHQSLSSPYCNWHLRSSLDNYATDIFSGQTTENWEYPEYFFTNFNNIVSAITFRFYITDIDANTTRWRQDNVIINGTISALSSSSTWYADVDNDSYGDAANSEVAITPTLPNAKLVAGDCNDNDNTIYPGATEICDGKDNDCDQVIDDGLTFLNYYADADGDSFGSSTTSPVNACSQPANTVLSNTDCDDNNSAINPQAIDIPDNGIDEDCSGLDATTASLGELSSELKIFPNPVTEELSIMTALSIDLVKIYALDGTLVLTSMPKNSKVNVATLAEGSYQLILLNKSTEVAKAMFIKK